MTYTNEEISEHRRKFYDALRSGKFQQGRKHLKYTAEYFCCLGVACEVSNLGTWRLNKDFLWEYLGSTDTLPKEVMEYYGFASKDPHIKDLNIVVTAIELNDAYRETFPQIADAFEAEYPV